MTSPLKYDRRWTSRSWGDLSRIDERVPHKNSVRLPGQQAHRPKQLRESTITR